MLGEYAINPTGTIAANDEALVVFAIGKVSTDAFAAGAASLPDPAAEPEYPWLYWASHPMIFGGSTLDPSTAPASLRHSFDVRTMRKFRPGESLVSVIQHVDVAGTPSMFLNIGHTRVLTTIH